MNIEKLVADMDAIVAAAEAENRSLSDDEVARYEGLERDLAAARKTGEIRARQKAYKTPLLPAVVAGRDDEDEAVTRAFDTYLRTGEGYELRALSVGTDSAGGYMVPTGFRAKLTERMKAFGGIEQVAQVITTETGNPLPWPTIDDTANSGEIVAEGASAAAGADPALAEKSLGAYKFTAQGTGNLPVKVSMELLQDAAFDVEDFLARLLGKRIQRKKAEMWAVGTGSSQPLGLVTGTADISLASGNAITYAKLLDVVHALDPDYRANARWVFADTALKAIRAVEDNNGRPLLNDANAAPNANSVGSLLGYPVTIDQGVAAYSDSGDATLFAAFGDIEEAYIVRNVRDIIVLVDPYSYSATGQVGFSAWARADGTIQNPHAVVTLAHFDAP